MEPLTAMVQDLSVTGARTAREMYGAGGWVVASQHRHLARERARSTGRSTACGRWAARGSRMALWDRYEYTGDRAYLRTIYPLLKGSAQFFLDTLVEEPTHHWLVTSPSLSPENPHPFGTSLVAGPTMDQADPARPVRAARSKAARELGVDARSAAALGRHARAARAAADRQRRASCRSGSRTGT